MSQFKVGDRVRARYSVQLLNTTETYTIDEVCVFPSPFGDFVTYIVHGNDGEPIAVNNGHLLLRKLDRIADPISDIHTETRETSK